MTRMTAFCDCTGNGFPSFRLMVPYPSFVEYNRVNGSW